MSYKKKLTYTYPKSRIEVTAYGKTPLNDFNAVKTMQTPGQPYTFGNPTVAVKDIYGIKAYTPLWANRSKSYPWYGSVDVKGFDYDQSKPIYKYQNDTPIMSNWDNQNTQGVDLFVANTHRFDPTKDRYKRLTTKNSEYGAGLGVTGFIEGAAGPFIYAKPEVTYKIPIGHSSKSRSSSSSSRNNAMLTHGVSARVEPSKSKNMHMPKFNELDLYGNLDAQYTYPLTYSNKNNNVSRQYILSSVLPNQFNYGANKLGTNIGAKARWDNGVSANLNAGVYYNPYNPSYKFVPQIQAGVSYEYKDGGLIKYESGSKVKPAWLQAVEETNKRINAEDAYIKNLGLDPNSLSPSQRQQALANFNINPKVSVALQNHAKKVAAQKAAAIEEVSRKFNIPAEVAARSLEYSESAPINPGTISEEKMIPTKEDVQYNFSHPLEYFTRRKNNFDALAGIPGYILTSAIPNTIYNLTPGLGLDETAGDLATVIEGYGNAFINDSMSSEQLDAFRRSFFRAGDAAAAAGVFRSPTSAIPRMSFEEPLLLEGSPEAFSEASPFLLNSAPEIDEVANAQSYATKIPPLVLTAANIENPIYLSEKSSIRPELYIKSTADMGFLEKQVSKGMINRKVIDSYLNGSNVGKGDKFILEKVLNENFPNQQKINYLELKNAVSNALVPFEKRVIPNFQWSNYGLPQIGFSTPNKEVILRAIDYANQDINRTNKLIEKIKLQTDISEEQKMEAISRYQQDIDDALVQIKMNEKLLKNAPLENETFVHANRNELGVGDDLHFKQALGDANNDVLAHTRTLVTQEEPEVMHYVEQQSDFWQDKDKKNWPEMERLLNENPEDYNTRIEYLKEQLEETNIKLEEQLNSENPDNNFIDILESNKKRLQNRISTEIGSRKNLQQKIFLGKNHQERLLQENVLNAIEKGKTKVRYPTPETAAKIQQYPKVSLRQTLNRLTFDFNFYKKLYPNPEQMIPAQEARSFFGLTTNEPIPAKEIFRSTEEKINELKKLSDEQLDFEDYKPQHKTILKKYEEVVDVIKKVYPNVKVRTVTDPKGNTWYEFDIPESLRKNPKIKAFKMGGWLNDYK